MLMITVRNRIIESVNVEFGRIHTRHLLDRAARDFGLLAILLDMGNCMLFAVESTDFTVGFHNGRLGYHRSFSNWHRQTSGHLRGLAA